MSNRVFTLTLVSIYVDFISLNKKASANIFFCMKVIYYLYK